MTRRNKTLSVYPRGEETRARILATAIQLFGLKGFDAVTTRMIAAEASVPAPSLRYYFANKEGLYAACWNTIREQLLEAMEPSLAAAEQLLAQENAERTQLIEAFCALQAAQLEHTIARPNAEAMAQFIARHDLDSSSGTRRLTMGDGATAYRMVTCYTRVVMRISGDTLDWQSALVVAGLLNGQLASIAAKRTGLAEIGIEFSGDRLAWLKRTIRQQTIAALLLHCA